MDGAIEDIRRRRKEAMPIPFPVLDGLPFPTFFPIRHKGISDAVTDIMTFSCRKSDIFICAWPKCGR